MRALNTLSTVGTTSLTLDNVEFLNGGEFCLVAAGDSVATATLTIQYGGIDVFSGPVPIESRTDGISFASDLCTIFRAPRNGKIIATLGGTVAGCRVNFLVLSPQEMAALAGSGIIPGLS